MATKKSTLKSGGHNRLGVGHGYQWQPGTTLRQAAEYLANDPNSGVSKGGYRKVGWGKQEWVRDLDDYDPTGRVMEYLSNAPAEIQKHYGVYGIINKSSVPTTAAQTTAPRRTVSTTKRAPSGSRMNYDGMSFNKAFASARRSGVGTFSWRGKQYTTDLAPVAPASAAVQPQPVEQVPMPTIEPEPMDRIAEGIEPYNDIYGNVMNNPYALHAFIVRGALLFGLMWTA